MKKGKQIKKSKYKLGSQGEFIIENYNHAKPFANFFPGIAGAYGIPIWAFYVNRGQAIASFGIKDKDHAILEFYPANKSWQMTSLQGFRTFLKVSSAKNTFFYEPFHNGHANLGYELSNRMKITSYDLKLEEENLTLQLNLSVNYFTIPNDNFGGLAREVTIKNTSKSAKKIELIDGLPQIAPFGTNNFFLKEMSRTIEAWMNVLNLENSVPFYKLAVDPQDRPEVVHIKEGNFYLGFCFEKDKAKIIKPIIDPVSVFGPITDLSCPSVFLHSKNFHPPKNEINNSKTPCAFLSSNFNLKSGEEKTFYSVSGYMINQKILNASILKITSPLYLAKKKEENQKIIEELQNNIATQTSLKEFDLYTKQTYLDNILRGGYPVIFQSNSNKTIFYLYSRKHGDLERDYNKFQLQPTYFSQGNGNYRDVNQNRRSDIWFNPDIEDENVIAFFNLIQADGFNPLVVKGATFSLKNPKDFETKLKNIVKSDKISELINLVNKPFTPGEVILFLEENKIKLNTSNDDFLNLLLSHSNKNQEAEHGEGFWTDHWTYNLDLLENYLALYPERLKEIIFQKKVFTFFDNTETVKPRSEKYVIYNNEVKQLHAVYSDQDKKELIHKRAYLPHIARAQQGKGEIYNTTLLNKILCLVANKATSLDPFGAGIEMEADKPNWYDSLNGLPALLGSSACETLELKRNILFLKTAISDTGVNELLITEEIWNLLNNINTCALEYFNDNLQNKDFLFWDKTHNLKEDYRFKTKFGFKGDEINVSANELTAVLDNLLEKINDGINKTVANNKNIYCAYFINEVVEYGLLKTNFVKPTKFKQKKLPLFLESQMHALKIARRPKQAKEIYEAVLKSPLYDKKLKMYKVTESLLSMPEEIGRCRIFTPGWLENESIWLHMEYKYLLEILRSGLYEEFYREFKNLLIPFQKPQTYGRSILENSSFLVSSAFPDKSLHGNGFVARLSGSTAEFLSIWLTMNLGLMPFGLNEKNELCLKFSPLLAGWLFNQKDKTYRFNFLSKTKVVYYNLKKRNTFGKDSVKPVKITFKDKFNQPVEIHSDTIPAPYAKQVRSRQIKEINIYLE